VAKVIMGIGIPGSGKTTVLKPFAQDNGYAYICPDEIRAEMTGDAGDQSKNSEVWDEARQRLADALQKGETIVFDAVFVNGSARKDFICFARNHGAEEVQGVFAAVPLETAEERNRARERVVSDAEMEKMFLALWSTPPSVEDGFDSVVDINEFQQLQRAEIKREDGGLVQEFKSKLR
jgi:predicted kinase